MQRTASQRTPSGTATQGAEQTITTRYAGINGNELARPDAVLDAVTRRMLQIRSIAELIGRSAAEPDAISSECMSGAAWAVRDLAREAEHLAYRLAGKSDAQEGRAAA